MEKNEIIDPFQEEDWDEIDAKILMLKIKIGGVTKNIDLMFFPAYIQKIDNDNIVIRDDRFNKIHANKLKNIQSSQKGIPLNHMLLIYEDFINEDVFSNFINKYLNNKKVSCLSNIKHFEKMLSNNYDYDNDEELDDYQIEKIEKNIELNKLLLENINKFNTTLEVKKIIKNYYKNY